MSNRRRLRRTNIAGIPITVGPVADLREELLTTNPTGAHLYVCLRVADEVTPPPVPALVARRKKTLCDDCRHPIWFDPAAEVYPAGATRVCHHCLKIRLNSEIATFRPAPENQT